MAMDLRGVDQRLLITRIVEIVTRERGTETEGSDENTEQDVEAYDEIIEVLREEGLVQ